MIPPNRFTLPLWRKILFGLGGFGVGIVRSVLGLFQLAFLLEVVQMPPLWAGLVLFIEQLVDSIVDGAIGLLSDNVPTRYGRRKPWIYVMCLPALIFWVLSWVAPGTLLKTPVAEFAYYLCIYCIFSVCIGCVQVPYQAIIPDIAPTSLERSLIVVIWQFFLVIGALCASFVWSSSILWFPVEEDQPTTIGMPENYRKGYAVASVITGVPFLVTTLIGISSVMERKEAFPFVSMRLIFRNTRQAILFRPFVILCIIRCASVMSIAMFVSNVYLYIKYVLKEEDHVNFILLALQCTVAVTLFVWLLLSLRVSKSLLFNIGSLMTCIALLLFFFAQPSWMPFLYILFVFRGATSSAAYLFPQSMLPDVIEYYYLEYLDRREGTFYSVINALEKFAIGICYVIVCVALHFAGYLNPSQIVEADYLQPESTLMTLRFLVSVVPMFFAGISIMAGLWFYLRVQRSERYNKGSDYLFSDFSDMSDVDSSDTSSH